MVSSTGIVIGADIHRERQRTGHSRYADGSRRKTFVQVSKTKKQTHSVHRVIMMTTVMSIVFVYIPICKFYIELRGAYIQMDDRLRVNTI